MGMTKKHFIAVARAIREDLEDCRIAEATARYAANVFATVARHDNPRFNRERFMRACGLVE
jgi:hypothetical protein